MKAVQRAGKCASRLTANRQQQNALLSSLQQLRRDAGFRQNDVAKVHGEPQAFVTIVSLAPRLLDLVELRGFRYRIHETVDRRFPSCSPAAHRRSEGKAHVLLELRNGVIFSTKTVRVFEATG
jgi:hypothetical protein